MKPIQKDELYENLSQFLKSRGIELKEGNYTKSVHAGCSMLADAINLSQAGLGRAKNELEKRLDQVRQVIHESTAPKQPGPTVKVETSEPNSDKSRAGVRSSPPRAKAATAKTRSKHSGQKGKSKGGKKRAK
jgi:hypothetical protein